MQGSHSVPGSQAPLGDPDHARGVDSGAAGALICNPFQFGAKGDGVTKDTRPLQRAIDTCAAAGGGTVVLERGTFLSGMIVLHSNITLHIEAGATLLGSRDDDDYPTTHPPTINTELANCKRALVYAEGANNVRIEGDGTIDGHADIPKWRGMALPEGERPMAIFTALSTNVSIENITVKNAATWAVVNLEVEHLVIRGITVDSTFGPTHDGIDVVDGRDVLIENCTITTGDDAVCLKSGSAKGLRDVTVRNCRIKGAGVANGVKFGTATVGPMRDMLFEDLSIEHAQAAAIAIESVDGSALSNLSFRRISVAHVGTPFFVLLGSRGNAPIGSIRSIRFDTIRAGSMRYPWGSLLSGAPSDASGSHDLQDISFSNLDVTFKAGDSMSGPHVFGSDESEVERFPEYAGGYPDPKFIFATPTSKAEVTRYALPGWAFFIRHARGVSFENCRIAVDGSETRVPIATNNAVVGGQCATR
jgi:hypothetical protein